MAGSAHEDSHDRQASRGGDALIDDTHARDVWKAWHRARIAAVTGAQGNLALIETRWYPAGSGIPASDLREAASGGVTVTELQRTDLDTGQTQHGLRRWNGDSPANAAFQGIDVYPYDPVWVVRGTYTALEQGHTVPFEHLRDNGRTRELAVPGRIDVSIDGTVHALSAFDDGGVLLLVFGDDTNGSETYEAGRLLFVPHETGDFAQSGTVTLDFNRAFVPPCGFSDQFNCPVPPPANRLGVAVRAGEKRPVFSDTHVSH